MDKNFIIDIIYTSLNYLKKENYKSYDFFDALSSPYLNKISNSFLRRIVIQLNGRSLINLRPVIGVEKKVHTKTLSDLLSIYSKLYRNEKKIEYLEKANYFYNLLLDRGIKQKESIAWGLNFPYTSRFVASTESTPNLFNTINSCMALLDYYQITGIKDIYGMITKILYFIFNDLGIVDINDGEKWLRYYPGQTIPTYNVNALAAFAFSRINIVFKKELIEKRIITSLVNFLKSGQNDDGSWYYSASENGRWIDGFHTGYILESLSYLVKHGLVDSSILKKGVNYFIKNLITDDGIPKYFNNSIYPIESQNCAQAIQTISKLIVNNGFELKELLGKIIFQTNRYLYNNNGYYYYKKTKFFTNKNVFFRWSVTPMLLALLFANDAL